MGSVQKEDIMSKQTWKLGGNAGQCVVEEKGRYTVFTFDQKEAALKWAKLKGSQVQTKIVGAAKIRSFIVIVKS